MMRNQRRYTADPTLAQVLLINGAFLVGYVALIGLALWLIKVLLAMGLAAIHG